MIKGIDTNQRIEYVSKEDKEDIKTIFIFKPLTAEEMLSFYSDNDSGQLKLTGNKIFDFLSLCLVEIKNYKEGNIRDLIKTLPPMILAELVQEAGRINKMTEQDQKN